MTVTLYRNGSVYSPADPLATAMLVDGGTVAWVGGEYAATSLADDSMRVIDLQGALVAPGFVDSHVHVTETGVMLDSLDLRGLRSARELLDRVAEAARRAESGDPAILGFGWDETSWAEQTLPSAAELDRAAGGREVYLSRVDVHSALVSSALAHRLSLAERGWLGASQVFGEINRLARAGAQALSPVARRRVQSRALQAAARAGYVAVAEMAVGTFEAAREDLAALMAVTEPGVEVLPYWGQLIGSADEGRAVLAELGQAGIRPLGFAGDLNVDGSLGSRTALLREDYSDQPGHRGTGYLDAGQIAAHLQACTELGVQGGFHVIGDAGLDRVIEGLRRAGERLGLSALRAAGHRLEHVEMADDASIATLAEFSVTASVQPAFDALWGGADSLYARRLGAQRAQGMNRFASFFSAGIPVALGSDAPVTPLDPWAAVAACLEHQEPGQRISARGAFLAHTRAGWRAARQDLMLGQLVPGAPASFAVWEVDELMVQVADERVQSWSTDPRSRTPLLPALDTENRPRALATVHRGVELFDSGELSAATRG
ncbi:amidohydrolase [Psychromicrobium xiongbiense]|uniref:amidohydrolase n=1 Tax=Psychromicrobium xiongbiense TaxID=3051184 RepID=UPI002556CA51|nr:amidohydrolase [Psychromicrobium sp. YIM S02556]